MKTDEYLEITAKLSEIMCSLEDLETTLISKFEAKCHTAVWVRLTSCFVVLTSLQFSQEYEHFADEQGGWSITE